MKWMGYVIWGVYVMSFVWILIGGFFQLHLLWHSKRKRKLRPGVFSGPLPRVTVQLPIYNERFVVEGLLESVARLDYPRDLLEIQVLDDSTDETIQVIDSKVAQLRLEGLQVTVLRRHDRQGYKAGALQYGLSQCSGDWIAIFDADFCPPPRFLLDLLPHFSDPRTGLVQARWGHRNGEQNFLTRVQTFLLDLHFKVEQAGRYQAGYFINFCGTAGVWRKQCIVDAGGWDGSVLSEDLDLSYRAQLRGWRMTYDQNLVVPAEVPAFMEAFKAQQFRWTKGIAQTARKTLPALFRSKLPLGKKLHAIFQLSSSLVFLFLFLNALLTLPLLVLRQYSPDFITLTNYTSLGALNLVLLTLLYYQGTREPGPAGGFFKNFPLFLVVYLAMSVQNAVAVAQGILGHRSPFVRTPKFLGSVVLSDQYLQKKCSWITWLEIGLLAYFLLGIGLSFYFGDYFLLLFFGMMSGGLSILVFYSLFPSGVEQKVKSAPVYQALVR